MPSSYRIVKNIGAAQTGSRHYSVRFYRDRALFSLLDSGYLSGNSFQRVTVILFRIDTGRWRQMPDNLFELEVRITDHKGSAARSTARSSLQEACPTSVGCGGTVWPECGTSGVTCFEGTPYNPGAR
jgi:hypothetical protein